MTCIIYDGATIAADRLITKEDKIVGEEKKIHKWSRGIWAASGNVEDGISFAEWLEDRDFDFTPSKNFDCLFTDDGKVFQVQRNLIAMPAYIPTGIGVAGSDAELLCKVGFTARQAVKAIMKISPLIGGKIDTVKIDRT